jgi:uncharacterized membrane protein YhdT
MWSDPFVTYVVGVAFLVAAGVLWVLLVSFAIASAREGHMLWRHVAFVVLGALELALGVALTLAIDRSRFRQSANWCLGPTLVVNSLIVIGLVMRGGLLGKCRFPAWAILACLVAIGGLVAVYGH